MGGQLVQLLREQVRDDVRRRTLAEFKAIVRDQAFMLLLDQEAAVAAIPALIPDAKSRRNTVAAIREVLGVTGAISGEVAERLQEISRLLGVQEDRAATSASAAA